MRHVPWSVVVGVCSLVLLGCASTPEEPEPQGRRPRGPAFGAVDESYRRESGQPSGSIFAPLDLPTPSDTRSASGAPGSKYWQQQVDYRIEAALDDQERRLSASMRIDYRNNSPDTLGYLWLGLEQNLFRPDSVGTLSRSPGGIMRELGEFWGGYELSPVTVQGDEVDLAVYGTVARLDLPRPISPGQSVELILRYSFPVPPHLRRMGAQDVEQGTIYEFAQWFPHVCVYDDVHGWNTLPYLGSGEFYTNYGDYDVSLTVPREYIVGGTGELINPNEVLTEQQRDRLREARASRDTVVVRSPEDVGDPASRPAGDGPLTWRFRAERVRTFAWAASPAFVWDACSATVTDFNGSQRPVLCQSLYPKEAEAWAPGAELGGSSRAIQHAIEFYSSFVYPYPYPQMTNVNGPEGGMEYPMTVFCGARTSPEGLFGVTDHEVGHSWFPMIVNTDERRHVWMDEGFNTFINMYSRADFYDRQIDTARAMQQVMEMSAESRPQPIATEPDNMWGRWVGRLGYRKTGYGLMLLREVVLGPERFDAAFRGYARRWAFKSPRPADFFRSIQDGAGMDLAWFWRGWFLETGSLDQAVTNVQQDADTKTASADFVNLGRLVMPVPFRVTYEDGTTEDRVLPVQAWASTDLWRHAWPTGGRVVTEVRIDPNGLLPDTDESNDVWP